MKGLAIVKSVLSSGKPLSKDSLPACDIDRDALIHVMAELYNENTSLKAKVAGAPLNTAGAASPSNAVGTPSNAAGTSVSSNAAGDMPPTNATHTHLNAATPVFEPAARNVVASSGKPESEKMCKAMWGKTTCPGLVPGVSCERVHMLLLLYG